jgi:hypothetical protein
MHGIRMSVNFHKKRRVVENRNQAPLRVFLAWFFGAVVLFFGEVGFSDLRAGDNECGDDANEPEGDGDDVFHIVNGEGGYACTVGKKEEAQ